MVLGRAGRTLPSYHSKMIPAFLAQTTGTNPTMSPRFRLSRNREPRLPVLPSKHRVRRASSSVTYASLVFRFFRFASKMYYVYLFPYLASCSCINCCLSQRPSSRSQKTKVLVNVFEIVGIKSYLHGSRLVFWILIFMYTYIYI